MVTIRCTQKLRSFLGITPIEDPDASTGALGDWYANLVPTYAGDLVIFVNERSLVTVAVPVKLVENLIPLFRQRVENLLLMMDVEQEVIDREISHLEPVQFAKTVSRSILGSMNDIAWNYQYISEEAEYISRLSLSDAELKLSMMPSGVLDHRLPAEVALELLERSNK